ncbi:MAG: hypothetical protein LRY48_01565, partial [Bacteroides graminisolvens]|nr:hypothetical protein [Bacteroides graminisolvens]
DNECCKGISRREEKRIEEKRIEEIKRKEKEATASEKESSNSGSKSSSWEGWLNEALGGAFVAGTSAHTLGVRWCFPAVSGSYFQGFQGTRTQAGNGGYDLFAARCEVVLQQLHSSGHCYEQTLARAD